MECKRHLRDWRAKCILTGMRSHRDIIRSAGVQVVHDAVGFADKMHTVRSWSQRDSIPAEHWQALSEARLASLEELAAAAARKREPA